VFKKHKQLRKNLKDLTLILSFKKYVCVSKSLDHFHPFWRCISIREMNLLCRAVKIIWKHEGYFCCLCLYYYLLAGIIGQLKGAIQQYRCCAPPPFGQPRPLLQHKLYPISHSLKCSSHLKLLDQTFSSLDFSKFINIR